MSIYTICDPRYNSGRPFKIDFLPTIINGFMYWRGELREVCEIHETAKGKQLELY